MALAVSGGLDSVVLLDVVSCWYREVWNRVKGHDLSFRILHVHHGMAQEAEKWAAGVEEQATTYGWPCQVLRLESAAKDALIRDQGVEGALHTLRYQAFASVLWPEECLLLAHHQTDQVETVLMQLFRGTHQNRWGMPRARPVGQGLLWRPFLSLSRETLWEYARERNLTWIEDPSNLDLSFDRNFLRQTVLPLLKTRWHALESKVAALSEDPLFHRRDPLWTWTHQCESTLGSPGPSFVWSLEEPPSVQRRRLAGWLQAVAGERLSGPYWSNLMRTVQETRIGRVPRWPLKKGTLWFYRGRLHWVPKGWCETLYARLAAATEQERALLGPGSVFCVQERPQQPLGTLKRKFQQAGIPLWCRPYWPLWESASEPRRLVVLGLQLATGLCVSG